MAIGISTAFDGGALGEIVEVTADRVVARIHRDWDQERRNTQATWYYARFDDLGGRPFSVQLTDLGSVYNGRPTVGGIVREDQGFVSDDGVTWRKLLSGEFDPATRTYHIQLQPIGDQLWIAALEPYVAADLAAFEQRILGHPELQREVIGQSVLGRDIVQWTIGKVTAPHAVFVLARQHAWETHTSYFAEGLTSWLLSDAAADFRRRCCVVVQPLLDPDGVASGASRFNHLGWDTNRHWDETDPDQPADQRLRPEICAGKRVVRDWLAAGRPLDLHLNIHDTQHDIFVAPAALADHPLLTGFYQAMQAATFSGQFRAEPHGPSGVSQNALHAEYGVPAALIELGTIRLPSIDDFPTRDYRRQFGAACAEALARLLS
ncbi:MAG: hypothetical protein IT204_15365 [Fimbriimonadaceae bacterium]|nr:hypothetical protein [Fimbriimonadaceae bacterium]